jgi:hypothetical protein
MIQQESVMATMAVIVAVTIEKAENSAFEINENKHRGVSLAKKHRGVSRAKNHRGVSRGAPPRQIV